MNWLVRSFVGTFCVLSVISALIAVTVVITEMGERAMNTGSYLWGTATGMAFFLIVWIVVFIIGYRD